MAQLATENPSTRQTSYQLYKGHVNDATEDNTGDSGLGTGSAVGPYSYVEIWRQAMKHPPPGMECAVTAKMRS